MLEQLGKQLIYLFSMIITLIIEYQIVKAAVKDSFSEMIKKEDDKDEDIHTRIN